MTAQWPRLHRVKEAEQWQVVTALRQQEAGELRVRDARARPLAQEAERFSPAQRRAQEGEQRRPLGARPLSVQEPVPLRRVRRVEEQDEEQQAAPGALLLSAQEPVPLHRVRHVEEEVQQAAPGAAERVRP